MVATQVIPQDDTQMMIPFNTVMLGMNTYLSMGRSIGDGTFANVRLGYMIESTNQSHAVPVAMKCISKNKVEDEFIQREIDILTRCSLVPRVASLYFSFETPDTRYIGMEYCPGNDLHRVFSTVGIGRDEALTYLYQIAVTLRELHKLDVIYHDLKLENICLDQNGNIKLVDFGLATLLTDENYNPATRRREIVSTAGTLEYAAPEIFMRVAHSFESDWWSYGVIAYELFCGTLPFAISGCSPVEQCTYICSDASFFRNEVICSGSFEEYFVSKFLVKNPKHRFGYETISSSSTDIDIELTMLLSLLTVNK